MRKSAAGRPRAERTERLLVYDGIACATKSNLSVGVRGDFSFVTFLCVVDKGK